MAVPSGDVFFLSITELSAKLRAKEFSAVELTKAFCDRLEKIGPTHNALAHSLRDQALKKAKNVDGDIKIDRLRGPLQGIPYGAKDLLAVKGQPTEWGSRVFAGQVFKEDARVIERLDKAGAILIGKLAMVELAGGVGYRTAAASSTGPALNPWDKTRWAGGSSSGAAVAVAAGLTTFALGSETSGSILTPSAFCGVTGLRPTYGLVSRRGAMALAWTLDKIGPMCRSVEDCALVLAAIQGPDGKDLAVQDVPFNWDASLDIRKLRVGYLKAAFEDTRQTPQVNANDAAALEKIRSLGVSLIEVAMPAHANVDATAIMYGEATAALRDPVESQPAKLVRQDRVTKQNSYRLLPAADYFNAQRMRMLLMQEMAAIMEKVDVYIAPFDYGDYTPNPVSNVNTSVTNLTGQPCVAVPHGFNEKGQPTCLVFHGRVYGEAQMLALANAYQSATEWHLKHPKLG